MTLVRLLGVATVISLISEDILLISQHTHVPMGLSRGADVAPHAAIEQERFTRSLRFPDWLSGLLLHFDAHELHHMYPFVPGHCLAEIPYSPANEVTCWRWIRAARAVPGEVLLISEPKYSRDTTYEHRRPGSAVLRALPHELHSRLPVCVTARGSPCPDLTGSRSRSTEDARSAAGVCSATTRPSAGFMVMVPATGLAFAFLASLLDVLPAGLKGLWPLSPAGYALLGSWAAVGFMAGELPNSFIKRQLGIAPGAAARGRFAGPLFFVVDRVDSILGLVLALIVAVPVPWRTWLCVALIGPALHGLFSVAFFRLGVKARPA